jgi:hypothetical protein
MAFDVDFIYMLCYNRMCFRGFTLGDIGGGRIQVGGHLQASNSQKIASLKFQFDWNWCGWSNLGACSTNDATTA